MIKKTSQRISERIYFLDLESVFHYNFTGIEKLILIRTLELLNIVRVIIYGR